MYVFFKDFALILFVCKVLGIVSRRFGLPQVVGEIIGGLLIGPCFLDLMESGDTISLFAEVGVILMMFSTGLSTDLKKLKKTGVLAFFMACAGVLLPLVGGWLLYSLIYGFGTIGSLEFYRALFIGTIMTATSVSITVAVLQEMGLVSSEIGTTIVSAAIIDDVIGILVLTCVVGACDGAGQGFLTVLLKTLLFFVFAFAAGFLFHRLMGYLDARFPHTQRIPIFSLAACFFMAYIAETCFGISDITGAYITGVALCTINDAPYIESKIDISTYMLFGPIFFANIGLKTTISGMDRQMIVFSLLFIVTALLCKLVSCGLIARIGGFSIRDSAMAGAGMMARGEVALIVAQKGLSIGLIDSSYFTPVILLIIISSILTSVLLHQLGKGNSPNSRQGF